NWYKDADGDGYGDNSGIASVACEEPADADYVRDNTDCDDSEATVYPGATELCDGIDNNCNNATDEEGTYTYKIGNGTDDAYEKRGAALLDGAMDISKGFYPMGTDESAYAVGLRFKIDDIPKGSTITDASITFTSSIFVGSSQPITYTAYAQYANTADTFNENSHNITNRPRTTANVEFTDNTYTDIGDEYETPSLKSVVQEVVSKADWDGKHIVFILIRGAGGQRKPYSYEGNSDKAPVLRISVGVCPTTTTSTSTTTTTTTQTVTTTTTPVVTTTTITPVTTTTTPVTTTIPVTTTTTPVTTTIPVTTTTTPVTTTIPGTTTTTAIQVTTTSGVVTTTTLEPYVFMKISNTPLESMVLSAPLNIMFLLDTSASMDGEMMTDEPPYGRFDIRDASGNTVYWNYGDNDPIQYGSNDSYLDQIRYVFSPPDPDNNKNYWKYKGNYSSGNTPNVQVMPFCFRSRWKSQWSGYNKMYYSPDVEYVPWPGYGSADPDTPYGYPTSPSANQTLDLNGVFTYIVDGTCSDIFDQPDFNPDEAPSDFIEIKRAHYYYQKDNGNIYLVEIVGEGGSYEIKYRRYTDSGQSERVQYSELSAYMSDPGGITSRSAEAERQNFANWYSYYRTRMQTAKAAVGRAIADMSGVQVGIMDIHDKDGVSPHRWKEVSPVGLNTSEGLKDETSQILSKLYNLPVTGEYTPLRPALERVGMYYDEKGGGYPALGDPPYDSGSGECQQNFVILMTDGAYNDPDFSGIGDEDGDGYGDTLADVAEIYYEKDLSERDNLVPSTDGSSHQHMVTYTVSFGANGNYEKTSYPGCSRSNSGGCPAWQNPESDDQAKIDDLWHAAVNGGGDYYNAKNPHELVNALSDIGSSIGEGGSGAASSVNAKKLADGSKLYYSTYDPSGWKGDLEAYSLNPYTGAVLGVAWSANKKLEDTVGGSGWSSRKILTYNGSSGIPFNFSELSNFQKAQLDADTGIAEAMVNYLKGDRSNEGSAFRTRDTYDDSESPPTLSGMLGDIIHASPVYIGEIGSGLIYSGANDGMLHMFDDDGNEIAAYIPNLVFDNLRNLTRIGYNHKYFIDATPYVATLDSEASNSSGKMLLIGGLGKGGKGYYCLDITNVSKNSPLTESNIMWEYPNPPFNEGDPGYPYASDPDMGFTYGKAYAVETNAGWVIIFGNGYDSENAKAVLYVLELDSSSNIAGVHKLDTGKGEHAGGRYPSVPHAGGNGLSSPALIDPDLNGIVDYAYAGDLQGNMWKFDLTSDDVDDWHIAYDGNPLFKARDANGNVQPITTEADVALHCEGKGGYIVVFATGRYLTEGDIKDSSTQTIYGIWDWAQEWEDRDQESDDKYLGSRDEHDSENNRTSLRHGATLLQQEEQPSDDGRLLTAREIQWYSPPTQPDEEEDSDVGWYFDLPRSGERVISNVAVRSGAVLVVSIIPSTEVSCSQGGSSIIQAIDVCTGGKTAEPYIDTNGDGKLDADDMTGMEVPGILPDVTVVENKSSDGDDGGGGDGGGDGGTATGFSGKKSMKLKGMGNSVYYWREMEY
ncbi:MAG: hypothetical protein DRI57_14820, partial [Deltaproteobacteria bacterium]